MNEDDRLTPELQSLLAAERDAPGPDAGMRDRVARKMASTLGATLAAVGASGASVSGAQAALPKALLGKSLATKLLVAALVGGVGAGGVAVTVVLVHRHARRAPEIAVPPVLPPSRPTVLPPVAATATADAPSLGAVQSAAAEVPSSPSRRAEPHRGAHRAELAAEHHSDLAAERALLIDARAAMQAADAPRALALLDDHARRFAGGQLAEERDALRVAALWLAGDHDGARRRADEFARRHPDSLFLPSVRRAVTDSAAPIQ
ncbi:MAG TPA: hypothetical protein VGL86_18855 [Polyangia bacterium]|jgi:hypothetical protein